MIPSILYRIVSISMITGMLLTHVRAQPDTIADQDSLYLRHLRKAAIEYYGISYRQMDSAGQVYLAESHRLGSTDNKISALQLLGTSQLETGNYGEALEYFLESLTLAEEIEHLPYKAMAYNNIATTFHFEERLEDAIDYYLKALQGFEAKQLRPRSAQVYYNIAIIYHDLGIQDSSVKYYQLGIKRASKYDDFRSLADLYNGLGNLSGEASDSEKSRLYLSKAIGYAKQAGDPQRSFYPLLNLGTDATHILDFKQASAYLHQAEEIAYRLESLDMKIDIEEALSELYSAMGRFQLAYEHAATLYELKEEQTSLEQESNLALLQEEFDSKEKALTLQANQRLIAQQKQALRLTSYLNIGLALVVFLIALIAYGYWRLSKIRKQHAKILVKLNEDKDNMLHAVAHDLQSPFVNIRGLTNLLQAESTSENTRKILEVITNELDKSDHLVRSLLDLESIESEEIPLHIEPISMTSLLLSIEEKYTSLADQHDILLQADGESTVVHSDKYFLERMIGNLISNAIKFSPGGTAVHLSLSKQQSGIVIRVKDEGPGFSSQDRKRMYGRFQRLTAQPTIGGPSVGLGLAITKALVERLNGTISLISSPGKGSEFSILIPTT